MMSFLFKNNRNSASKRQDASARMHESVYEDLDFFNKNIYPLVMSNQLPLG